MIVLVTGATGVLGRATLPLLLTAGHTVRAISRSPDNDEQLRALGAEPVRTDIFDADALGVAIAGGEGVLHLATAIPPTRAARRRDAWATNDRIRAQGTRALVDTALAAGVEVLVYPSVTFVYPDRGDAWIGATTASPAPIDLLRSTVTAEEEVARFAAGTSGKRRGVVLRLAGLGGPADAYTPMLWVDDAATALVAGLERAPSGIYDVTNDEPLRQREIVAALAGAVGRRWLMRPPVVVTR